MYIGTAWPLYPREGIAGQSAIRNLFTWPWGSLPTLAVSVTSLLNRCVMTFRAPCSFREQSRKSVSDCVVRVDVAVSLVAANSFIQY
jgi:hypothetical protein